MIFPSSVKISPESTIRRDLRGLEPNHGSQPFSDAELANYDWKTIFYDVFRSANGKKIIAFGPPPLNFLSNLKKMKVWFLVNTETVLAKHKVEVAHGFMCIVTIVIPDEFEHVPEIRLQFDIPDLWKGSIETQQADSTPSFLTLCTVSKDNPVLWMKDWFIYYANLGVDRFIIYDNGSTNREELVKMVSTLNISSEIHLFAWDFPYGTIRQNKNMYCQIGALNHSIKRFEGTEWIINVDIDEYVIPRFTDGTLRDFLAMQSDLVGCVSFQRHNIVAHSEDLVKRHPNISVRDCTFRSITPVKLKKYIARRSAVSALKVHFTELNPGFKDFEIDSNLVPCLHYLPLTTNWHVKQGWINNRISLAFSQGQSSNIVYDDAVIKRL